MSRLRVPLCVLILLGPMAAGCLATTEEVDPASVTGEGPLTFPTDGPYSVPLTPALYDALDGAKFTLGSFDGTPIVAAVFRPAIPGCEWAMEQLPEACRLPVVLSASPYWGAGVDQPDHGTSPPLVEWLVPRGYAVVHMSVRGSGESGGCIQLGGPTEQRDLDLMITWLAEQPWSNGRVAMTGLSYLGGTSYLGAATGNPHLKTIVPMSGMTDWADLIFKNGTRDVRSPILHGFFFANFGLGAKTRSQDLTPCDDLATDAAAAPLAAATASTDAAYWQERDARPGILENYGGSMWVIHGLQDYRIPGPEGVHFEVNPSQAVPFLQDVQAAGIPTRVWLGQWGHHFPDRPDLHDHPRWDFAHELVTWMDHYLKAVGEPPELGVEVQDREGTWRTEATYPPADVEWRRFDLLPGGHLGEGGSDAAGQFTLTGPPSRAAAGISVGDDVGPEAVFTSDPLARELRIAGLTRLAVSVTPFTADGGLLYAALYDVAPDGRAERLGAAGIHLAHHAGGNDQPALLAPGEAVVAHMEFEPLDAAVPEGHQLRLVVHRGGLASAAAGTTASPVVLALGAGESVLRLPTVERQA